MALTRPLVSIMLVVLVTGGLATGAAQSGSPIDPLVGAGLRASCGM